MRLYPHIRHRNSFMQHCYNFIPFEKNGQTLIAGFMIPYNDVNENMTGKYPNNRTET